MRFKRSEFSVKAVEDDHDLRELHIPLRLILLKDLPLGVVANGFDVDEAA